MPRSSSWPAIFEYFCHGLLRELYDDALPETKHFFESCKNYSDFAKKAIDQGIPPPFGDVLAVRKLSWQQLGVKWTVEWDNNYRTTVMAEGFVAMIQILLTDLRKIELSLFPTAVDITIKVHSGKLRIEDTPSNERVIRKVFLPEKGMTPELVFGIAATILKVVSAYTHEQFLSMIQQRMRLGLPQKTSPHAPYDVLFREFYLEDDYEALHKLSVGSGLEVPSFTGETHEGLIGRSGIHKDYDPDKSRQAVENRYKNSKRLLKYTLPRLMSDKTFPLTVADLRNAGWKDWHILLAVGGVRLNFVMDQILPKTASATEHKKVFKEVLDRDELESDPAPPPEVFTIDKLRFALKLSQLSTLKGMGYDCWQETPVTDAVDAFLRRFNYWTDDVAHVDPFLPLN